MFLLEAATKDRHWEEWQRSAQEKAQSLRARDPSPAQTTGRPMERSHPEVKPARQFVASTTLNSYMHLDTDDGSIGEEERTAGAHAGTRATSSNRTTTRVDEPEIGRDRMDDEYTTQTRTRVRAQVTSCFHRQHGREESDPEGEPRCSHAAPSDGRSPALQSRAHEAKEARITE